MRIRFLGSLRAGDCTFQSIEINDDLTFTIANDTIAWRLLCLSERFPVSNEEIKKTIYFETNIIIPICRKSSPIPRGIPI